MPIIGARAARIGIGRKTYSEFKSCLKKWAKEAEEEEEEEGRVEELLREVAYNILDETDTEGQNLEQVKQIFSI